VLQKKYRLLRISFTVLLVGMGVGVLLFVGTIALRTPTLQATNVPVVTGLAPADEAPAAPLSPAPADTVAP
jgi:hypothetical protein